MSKGWFLFRKVDFFNLNTISSCFILFTDFETVFIFAQGWCLRKTLFNRNVPVRVRKQKAFNLCLLLVLSYGFFLISARQTTSAVKRVKNKSIQSVYEPRWKYSLVQEGSLDGPNFCSFSSSGEWRLILWRYYFSLINHLKGC